MFCKYCRTKQSEQARYCSECGKQLIINGLELKDYQNEVSKYTGNRKVFKSDIQAISELPTVKEKVEMKSSIETNNSRYETKKKRNIKRLLYVVIPIISLVGFAGAVLSFYINETDVNEQVLALKKSSETYALEEKYDEALADIDQALKLRPSYQALLQNQALIKHVKNYAVSIEEITGLIKEHKFQDAENKLADVKSAIQQEDGPLILPLQKKVEELEGNIKVGTIKMELDELTTISELGNKLTIVSTLSSDEAKTIKEQIVNKIVQLTSTKSESLLKENKFSEALSVIEEGLQYAQKDEKLKSLQDRVESEKLAFEKAEQERIEKAMEAAAKEDLQNRTAAVEVTNFEVSIDEWGDLYVRGDVKNVATTGISSINISYTIYNQEGMELGGHSTTVYPHHLNVDESGSFQDIYYGIYEDVTVEIDNITWYLD